MQTGESHRLHRRFRHANVIASWSELIQIFGVDQTVEYSKEHQLSMPQFATFIHEDAHALTS